MTEESDTNDAEHSPTTFRPLDLDDLDEDLDEAVQEAQQRREQAIASIRRLREVEEELHTRADTLQAQGLMDERARDAVDEAIADGEYGAARQIIQKCTPSLEFDDDEKQTLVAAIGQEFEELVAHLEFVRNALVSIRDSGWEDEDLVAYIYGQHPSLTKKSIRGALDVVGDVSDTDVDDEILASYIAHNSRDVRMGDARTVVEALKDANTKAGHKGSEDGN